MTATCFIYGLIDPRTGEVRYIGRTSSGMKRPKAHLTPSRLAKDHSHKARWLRLLIAQGLTYEIRILESIEQEFLGLAEIQWIEKGRSKGWPLTHITGGGEGGHLGEKFTPEHCAKISAANKGRRITDEQRAKISRACRGRKLSAAQKEALRNAWAGRRHTAETRAKVGAAHRGKVVSAESRAKTGKANSRAVVELTTAQQFPSVKAAARAFGILAGNISKVLTGKHKRTAGLEFVYA